MGITKRGLKEVLPGPLSDKDAKKMISEADTKGSGKIDFKDFVFFIQEKLGSADMFDKRPNSFLRKLNLLPKDAAPDSSGDSKRSISPMPPSGEDFNKSLRRDEEIEHL